MAFTLPNVTVAGFTDQAEPDSVDIGILTAGHSITGVVSGCAVTPQGSPDMTVAVASGTISVLGVQQAVTSGNVTITAAHATLARKDIVVVSSAGVKSVTAGAAAAQPLKPSVPANSVVLAEVYVPAADTAIQGNQITDKRVIVLAYLSGKVQAVRKSADTSRSSTATPTADPHLILPIGVSEIWVFSAYISQALASAGTSGWRMTFTGPAGATGSWGFTSPEFGDSSGQLGTTQPLGTVYAKTIGTGADLPWMCTWGRS